MMLTVSAPSAAAAQRALAWKPTNSTVLRGLPQAVRR
jgi:hypothetical protein